MEMVAEMDMSETTLDVGHARMVMLADLVWEAMPDEENDALSWADLGIIARHLYVKDRDNLTDINIDLFGKYGTSDRWLGQTGVVRKRSEIRKYLAGTGRFVAQTWDGLCYRGTAQDHIVHVDRESRRTATQRANILDDVLEYRKHLPEDLQNQLQKIVDRLESTPQLEDSNGR